MTSETIISTNPSTGYREGVDRMTDVISLRGQPLPIPPTGYVKLHAICESGPEDAHLVRIDDVGIEAEYRAARLLAESVGFDLEG